MGLSPMPLLQKAYIPVRLLPHIIIIALWLHTSKADKLRSDRPPYPDAGRLIMNPVASENYSMEESYESPS